MQEHQPSNDPLPSHLRWFAPWTWERVDQFWLFVLLAYLSLLAWAVVDALGFTTMVSRS